MSSGWDGVLSILRCPVTGYELVRKNGCLVTEDGSRRYPIVDNVPVLLPEHSLFALDRYEPRTDGGDHDSGAVRHNLRRLTTHLPTLSRNYGTERNWARLADELREIAKREGRRTRVLVVGGRVAGVGAQLVLDSGDLDILETDVVFGPRTHLVCDAHDLPFESESFDAVVCQAVLEHVADPFRCAAEIRRVLTTSGLVYSEIPFLQQVHGGAFDFTRFTLLGHRRLWRDFDRIAHGAHNGPGMALAWSLDYFLRSLPRSGLGRAVMKRTARCLFFPLLYLDRWLVQRPAGADAAGGTFFLGRKRVEPLSDRAIVASYFGVGERFGTNELP
jgi:SAM-dependent methyltransferase